MGQVLHGCATTTHAVRTAIQRSEAPLKELATRYGLNHKTVAKWRKRAFVNDAPMGPKTPRSTVLSSEEEALIVAFRKHTLLPLDDCLYGLQATIPQILASLLPAPSDQPSAGDAARQAPQEEVQNLPHRLLPRCRFGYRRLLCIARRTASVVVGAAGEESAQ